ncbi:MAG: hypothetical protein HDQ95_08690 [Roseburia sp.]|nr:hypothetical protein [Roseburia sp.]
MNKKITWRNRLLSYIRRNYDNILMVIGFSLTFFLFTNVTRLLSDSMSLDDDIDGFQYTETYQYLPVSLELEDLQKMTEALEGSGLNCKIEGGRFQIGTLFDRTEVSVYLVTEAFSQDTFACREEENSVLIGDSMDVYTYERDGTEYLSMEGMEYKVFDKLENHAMADHRIYLFWQNLSGEYQTDVLAAMNDKFSSFENFYLTLQGNEPFDGKQEAFLSALSDRIIHIQEYDSSDYLVSFHTEFCRNAFVILAVFAVVCCGTIAVLWISRRKREYLIRRTFGYDTVRMIGIIWREISGIALLSLLLSWILEVAYMFFNGIYMTDLYRGLAGILISFVGAFLIVGLVVLHPMIQIIRMHPTQGAIDSIE